MISNQVLATTEVRERTINRLLNTKNLDLYFSNSYMECYYIC